MRAYLSTAHGPTCPWIGTGCQLALCPSRESPRRIALLLAAGPSCARSQEPPTCADHWCGVWSSPSKQQDTTPL